MRDSRDMDEAGHTVHVVSGITGLQQYSTEVISRNVIRGLGELGVTCREHRMEPGGIRRGSRLGLLAEVAYRYFVYPLWCRSRIPPGALVLVTDHANSTVVRCLKADTRSVIYLHDLTSLRPPWDYPFRLRTRNVAIWILSVLFKRRGIRAADMICTNSGFTADEVRRYLRIPADRLRVAHYGLDHETFYPRPSDPARETLELDDATLAIASVGPASLRKNLRTIAAAVRRLHEQGQPVRWLHVGRIDARSRAILEEGDCSQYLSEFEHITDERLVTIYAAADRFVQASLYEGFGMPPLEALAVGTPVAASRIPPAVEVLDDYATFFKPNDDAALADILRADAAQPHAGRARAPEGSAAHAAGYQWTACAQSLHAALVQVGSRQTAEEGAA